MSRVSFADLAIGTFLMAFGVLAVDHYTRPLFSARGAWAVVKYGMLPVGVLAFLQLWMRLTVESALVDGSNVYDHDNDDDGGASNPGVRLVRRDGGTASDAALGLFTAVVTTDLCLLAAAAATIRVDCIPVALCATILALWAVLQRHLYSYRDNHKRQQFAQIVGLLSSGTVIMVCWLVYCAGHAADVHMRLLAAGRAPEEAEPRDKRRAKNFRPARYQSKLKIKSARSMRH